MPEQDPSLETIEAGKRIAKLDLETRALTRNLSFWGTTLEWLKAAGVPVAIVGVVVTFALGIAQIHRSEQQLLSDQFDKILARMLGGKPPERVAAVGGLTLFLADERKDFHQSALTYLVGAAAVETDPAVQVTLLNVLSTLRPDQQISHQSLDSALQLAIVHSRRLMQEALASANQEIQRNDYLDSALHENHKFRDNTQTRQAMAKLQHVDYLTFLNRFYPRDHHATTAFPGGREPANTLRIAPDTKNIGGLATLAGIIQQLVSLGAYAKDYSGIYCEKCDFTKVPHDHFVGTVFDGAVLSDADFSRLNLRQAQFVDADLRGTIFFGTDLSDATLNWLRPRDAYRPDLQRRILTSATRGRPAFPFLECATVDGTNLDGLVIGAIQIHANKETSIIVTRPRMQSIRFERRPALTTVRILVETQVPDGWLQAQVLDDSFRSNIRRFGEGNVMTIDDLIAPDRFHWGHSSVLHALGGDPTHNERDQTVNILTVGRIVADQRNVAGIETVNAVKAITAQKFLTDLGISTIAPTDPAVAAYRTLGKEPIDCAAKPLPDSRKLQERGIHFAH